MKTKFNLTFVPKQEIVAVVCCLARLLWDVVAEIQFNWKTLFNTGQLLCSELKFQFWRNNFSRCFLFFEKVTIVCSNKFVQCVLWFASTHMLISLPVGGHWTSLTWVWDQFEKWLQDLFNQCLWLEVRWSWRKMTPITNQTNFHSYMDQQSLDVSII